MRERHKSEAIAGGVSTQFEDLIKNLKQTKAVQKKAKEKQQQEKNARLIGKIQKKKKKKENRNRKCKTENRIAWLRKDQKYRG